MVASAHKHVGGPGFGRLLRWDVHALGLRRTWWLAAAILCLICMPLFWWAASLPADDTRLFESVESGLVAWLISTPARDTALRADQMTTGYLFLRYFTWLAMALGLVAVPAVSAGSIAMDRRKGRLDELRLTLVPSRNLYLSKVLAASAGILLPTAAVLLAVAPLLVLERVAVGSIARLCIELIDSTVMIASVAVACSAIFRWPGSGRVAAYLALFGLLPFCWSVIVGRGQFVFAIFEGEHLWHSIASFVDALVVLPYDELVSRQRLFECVVIAASYLLAVPRLDARGFRRGLAVELSAPLDWLRGLMARRSVDARTAGRS